MRYPLKGNINSKSKGEEVYYKQVGAEKNFQYLQFIGNLLVDLVTAYPKVVALGGDAIKPLLVIATKDEQRRPIIFQIVQDIAQQTTKKPKSQASKLLCTRCLKRSFGTCQVKFPEERPVSYYGCQLCGQTRNFFSGKVIAVLDDKMEASYLLQDKVVRINWLSYRKLFDFDKVEIIQASDEYVERFAVQVGNDVDKRQSYGQIHCLVSSQCKLSDNTMKILQHTFGVVNM